MIFGALVLPDLMTFLMAFPFLTIELTCLLAALIRVTYLVNVSLNAPACLMAVLVTVVSLKVVMPGW